MTYKVIKFFTDLQDKNHAYNVGDVYPREGLAPTNERIAELSSSRNRQRTPLIEAVEDEVETVEETVEDEETTETEESVEKDSETEEEKPSKRRKRSE